MKRFYSTMLLLIVVLAALALSACQSSNFTPPEYDPLAPEGSEFIFTLLDNGTYSVKKGSHQLTHLVIPETYNGKPVTEIGTKGFSGCVFQKVTIPNSIQKIGSGAFDSCISLTSVTLPDSLTEIAASTFANCVYLEEINLPKSVTSIGASAFQGCTSLKTFSLHEGVTHIGSNAFYNCKSLATISLPDSLTEVGKDAFAVLGNDTFIEPNDLVYNELDGDLYLGNAKNPYVVLIRVGDRSVPSYTVNSGTRVIYSSACSSASMTSILLHDNVKGIGPYAFSWCRSLQSIHIPDGVLTIGEDAFWGCSSMTEVTGMNNVTSINDYAFGYCSSLKTLALSDKLTHVGDNVFSSTNALVTTIEGEISYIGSPTNPHMILLRVTDKTKASYSIHADTKIIYQYAFQSCEDLTEIVVPEGVRVLGNGAFSGCKMLGDVTLPSTLQTVGTSAFRNCKRLFSATIPENVTYIGSGVFYGCSLSKVTLPFIGEYASGAGNPLFGHIFGISDIGQHPTKIPTSLTQVVVTNCTTLGPSAFSDCHTITSITLPSTLKVIHVGAFYFTKNLKKLYINDIGAWCGVELADVTSTPLGYGGTLYLNGKKAESVVIPEGVSEIKTYTFYNHQSITSLEIPGTVKKVGDCAFEGCTALTSVTIGEGADIIGCAVFKNCAALTDVTLPDSVTHIDSNAFRGCSALEKIDLPKSLVFLADHVFKNCESLKKVNFSTKSGWHLCETRLLLNPEKINVWNDAKNAERLTGDNVTLYLARDAK
ncbi:MAG: leucine-rich repeat domain-containing protein [Clostridia bacterium]|nr:leucine-rich repeat domain-containing protein [Clostridia bacterium]